MLKHCIDQFINQFIVSIVSRDIVAVEAHYHHSCYKNYTQVKTKEYIGTKEKKDEADVEKQYEMVEKKVTKSFSNIYKN